MCGTTDSSFQSSNTLTLSLPQATVVNKSALSAGVDRSWHILHASEIYHILHSNGLWGTTHCGVLSKNYSAAKELNNTSVWSLIELTSLYTVPLSAVNGLSRVTSTSNGQAWSIWKFSNRPITLESNRIGTADSNLNRISKLRRS